MSQLHQNKRKGFTLLEILLVIAAIGILAAIVLIAINPTRQINQARQASINSEKNAIAKAIEQYVIDNQTYPADITETSKAICNNTVTTNCANLSSLVPTYIANIPSGNTYTVAKGNDGRAYVNTTETAANLTCPTGYIKVPGNSLYQTKDFCVAKYEMKAVAISAPTVGLTTPNTGINGIANNTTATTSANGRAIASVASGYPIANISQITAIDYCANQNTVSGASLITNAEWMTIARNIEAQLSNWTTGTAASTAIGTGGLYRGHSDTTPFGALEAGADNNGYIGTGQSGFSIERRTHTLSNGEVIWDLSGNMFEWTNDTIIGVNKPNNSPESFYQQWTAISNFGTLSYDLTRPSNNTWNSTQNMGQYDSGDLTGGPFAFLRGGDWAGITPGPIAGVFTLSLDSTPAGANPFIGFRCVVR